MNTQSTYHASRKTVSRNNNLNGPIDPAFAQNPPTPETTSMETVYGYMRVSTTDQNLDRQRIALENYNIPAEHIFSDKLSGKNFNRDGYQALKSTLKKDDLLVIKSIDRLGRDYNEIQEEWRVITKVIQADIFVLDMPILDTRQCKNLLGTFIADLVLQVLSFVAQNEREAIRQRQAEGIAAARLRGIMFGRPRKSRPENYSDLKKRYQTRDISLAFAANAAGVASGTFKKWLAEDLAECIYDSIADGFNDSGSAAHISGKSGPDVGVDHAAEIDRESTDEEFIDPNDRAISNEENDETQDVINTATASDKNEFMPEKEAKTPTSEDELDSCPPQAKSYTQTVNPVNDSPIETNLSKDGKETDGCLSYHGRST